MQRILLLAERLLGSKAFYILDFRVVISRLHCLCLTLLRIESVMTEPCTLLNQLW